MSTRTLRRDHAALMAILDVGIRQAADPEVYPKSASSVSSWSVKDHLEHLSIANEGAVDWVHRVCDGEEGDGPGGHPTLLGRIVMLAGDFPRGRGKAPERTVPKDTDPEELVARSRRVRERTGALQAALERVGASRATRNHFAFGDLNPAQWVRFTLIHNRHHQKIIQDILRAS